MTPERFKEIKARYEAATKMSDPCKHPGCHSHLTHPCKGCGRQGGFASWRTLLGIVRQDLPDCLDEIKRLRGAVKHTVTPFCTHCGKRWPTMPAADTDALAAIQPEINKHVAACSKNPLVAEIKRLKFELRSFEYTQRAVSEIWKMLGVETYEQAKGKSVDELVQAEIERLQELVKAAFREGGELVFKDNMFDEDNYCWDHSKALKELESNCKDAGD